MNHCAPTLPGLGFGSRSRAGAWSLDSGRVKWELSCLILLDSVHNNRNRHTIKIPNRLATDPGLKLKASAIDVFKNSI